MFSQRLRRRIFYVGGGTLAVLLFICLILRSLPLTQQDIDGSAVTVKQSSFYQLEVANNPIMYFSDYRDSLLVGGSVDKKNITKRETLLHGYWVNVLPILPTSFGHIMVSWRNRPSPIVNLHSQGIHNLVNHILSQLEIEMGGLQTKRNELGYYLRVHSVQDYGYNKIADYHAEVVHQMDSLQKIITVLHKITPSDNLRIRQINHYITTSNFSSSDQLICNRKDIDRTYNAVLLRVKNGWTPFNVTTKMSKSDAFQTLKNHYDESKEIDNTIPKGAISDSLGYYVGEQKKGLANGYGQYFGNDGSYYDGHWKEGKRDGFGIYIAPYQYLQVGEWKQNQFKGERLTYNVDRIYGIDLSKHQHEKNNNHYEIDWKHLRIYHLGTLSSKTIKGNVDYPVSFAYIKSTEGCTVLNPYYYSDYTAARQHNIRVGTYHFFSTTSSGAAQATYFLSKSRFQKGDLPPVLDVEPSDNQIANMGGPEVMFRQIRAWMSTVFKQTGKRPILYISQMFANEYMPLAPDLGDNYLVWIARYGEYKPNFKLAYWQLSPDGKVRGIHGDVDINVFNGYKNQYQDFLKRHCF